MTLEFDRWIGAKPYPNLARWQAQPYTVQWRQFSQHWPFSEPPMLWEYMQDENVQDSQDNKYLVAVSFFDFTIDWPSLLPPDRLQALRDRRLRLIFYYSEGDHPGRMLDHLDQQFSAAGVDPACLRLISANSAADNLERGAWLADDELLFRKRNRSCQPVQAHDFPRSRLFTALVRTHKWWRATIMADFWRRGWHEKGYFSYNPSITVGDRECDNPIEVDRWPGLRAATHEFLANTWRADDFSADQHNDHHLVMPEHFSNAYLNIVIETHMDVDQSGGVFLTEKTFKPIKNAQPFVIFGAAGSLARLRDLGYRTFDSVIDPSYDQVENTTDRYTYLLALLDDLFSNGRLGMQVLYERCMVDILHNQRVFLDGKQDRLNKVFQKICRP